MIKIMYTSPYARTSKLEVSIPLHVSFNKAPKFPWPYSPQIIEKEKDMGYAKKNWNKRHAKESMKKKKKKGKVRKDSPCLSKEKEFQGESKSMLFKGVHIYISTIFTHMHILIMLYDS